MKQEALWSDVRYLNIAMSAMGLETKDRCDEEAQQYFKSGNRP
jgi:hypothetical protein